MRAIIIGAGNAGRVLADRLCREQHDVVVIDRKRAPLQALESQYDILTVQGSGSSPRILNEAGVQKADVLAAVTSDDEANILACTCAQAVGVRYRIARVSSPDFLAPESPLDLSKLGVDLAITPEYECARDIARLIRFPAAHEVVPLLRGKILVAGLPVPPESPLLGKPLHSFADNEWLQKARFIGVRRDQQAFIPQGETVLAPGDDVYVAAEPATIHGLFGWVGVNHSRIRKVLIGGGGDLGLNLAQRLEKELSTVLIENDEVHAVYCSGTLDKTLVIQASVMDFEALHEAGVNEETAYVAATGDEENNIISCLLARKIGAALTVAEISTPEYVPIVAGLQLLDRAASTHLSLVNAILRFIRGRNVRAAALFQNLPGEVIEVVLSEDAPWAGHPVRKLRIPQDAVIVAVFRDGAVEVPTGVTQLMAGDQLVLYAQGNAIRKLKSILQY